MMRKDNSKSNSLMRKVKTDIGTFTVHFPVAVFNPGDKLNEIPKVVENFVFEKPNPNFHFDSEEHQRAYVNNVHDRNAQRLQAELNEAVKFGIGSPSFGVELLYAQREVVLI